MKGEFKVVLWARILALLLSPIAIGFLIFAIIGDTDKSGSDWLFRTFMLVCGLGFSFLIVASMKSKIIIDEEKITQVEIYGTRVIRANEIKGYRLDDKYLRLIPNDPKQKNVLISTYIQRFRDIRGWIMMNFDDLVANEAQQEEEKILADRSLGTTVEERAQKLKQASKAAKYINILGGAATAWILFYPTPYTAAVTIAMLTPVAGLVVMFMYRGLMALDSYDQSPNPNVMFATVLPGIGLMLRALFDFDLIYESNVWYYTVGAAVAYGFLLHEAGRPSKNRKLWLLEIVLVIMFSMAYSFGSFVMVNCAYDSSKPALFNVKVIDKRISSGKTTSYYLELEPWGPFAELEEAKISRDEYESVTVGDSVHTALKPGLLNTKWYYVITD